MSKFKVQFVSIDVLADGDGVFDGAGEFYWTFKVDNDVVSARDRSAPASAHDGQVISVNQSAEIERTADETFTVYGAVSESDDLFSGADDHAGTFQHSYSGAGHNMGPKSVHLVGDGVSVIVHYSVSRLP